MSAGTQLPLKHNMMNSKLVVLIVLAQIVTIRSVQFIIRNNIPGPAWIGIQGNPGHAHLHNGGFALNQNEEKVVNSGENWAGRFWARTWCEPNSGNCQTGSCGNKLECAGSGGVPPATLVEITLRGAGDQDFYDVSLVDGYNVLATISPQNGQGNCQTVSCNFNLNNECPHHLKVVGGNGYDVLACKSSCLQENTDQLCCRGQYNSPNVCKPSNMPPQNSAGYFKQHCPQYYSYAYDDPTSTFTCRASTYRITFS